MWPGCRQVVQVNDRFFDYGAHAVEGLDHYRGLPAAELTGWGKAHDFGQEGDGLACAGESALEVAQNLSDHFDFRQGCDQAKGLRCAPVLQFVPPLVGVSESSGVEEDVPQ